MDAKKAKVEKVKKTIASRKAETKKRLDQKKTTDKIKRNQAMANKKATEKVNKLSKERAKLQGSLKKVQG